MNAYLGFFAALGLCFVAAHAEEDYSKESIKATHLAANLYMLEGAGGNMTALIGTDGTLLVDDDFAPMADKLVGKLKELGGGSPRYIVNTHFHYDHTGANEIFGPTSTIIAATAVRNRLMSEQVLWHETHPPAQPQALPQLTFDNSLTLHINQEDVLILHLPKGHTDGDSVVWFKKNAVVCMGDLYFSGMYPIFHPEHGGSLRGYVDNLAQVLSLIPDGTQIVPGHGPLTSKAEMQKYLEMIRASIKTVDREMKAGWSLERIKKAGLPKIWETFSHGYLTTEKWLALISTNLKH